MPARSGTQKAPAGPRDGGPRDGGPGDGGTPPVAPWRPHELSHHGDLRVDGRYWLRDADDPEVRAHLDAEHAHYRAAGTHFEELTEAIYAETIARITLTDIEVPAPKGAWSYFSRTVEGKDYRIHCRTPNPQPAGAAGTQGEAGAGGTQGEAGAGLEEVVLDENAEGDGLAYFMLGGLAMSPDGRLAAWCADCTGAERFTLRIRDVATGRDLDDVIEDTSYGLAWSSDSRVLFYARADDANRPFELWRHTVGTAPGEDSLLYREDDESFFLGLANTKDDRYVVCESSSKRTSEVRLLDAAAPESAWILVQERRPGVEYSVEHLDGRLHMVTNEDAPNFRLQTASFGPGGPGAWAPAVAYDPEVRIEDVDVFAGHLVLPERSGGVTRLRVVDLATGECHSVTAAEEVGTVTLGRNLDACSKTLRYRCESLTMPDSTYDYDLGTRRATLRKRREVRGGYDPARFSSRRLVATAPDGTGVPISLAGPRAVLEAGRPDDPMACLLYGYGAYEIPIDPWFSNARVSLLERGVLFAIAHVRGGGELGRPWYEAGRRKTKPNTFTDFVACARHLVDEGWSAPEKLAVRGGSAGGMLVGAVVNLEPALFRAAVAEVPFVDCLTTMCDPSLPLTVTEWDEWGNPLEDPEAYELMKSYSPYDNVMPGVRYPAVLATAGLTDPRVGFWEPAKWVQALRAAHPDNRALLKIELESGHAGPSGRYRQWREEAEVLAFICTELGVA